MATLTPDAPTVNPARGPRAASLTIKGAAYDATPIDAGEDGTAAYRLVRRRGGACYDVIRTHAGLVECDCPDYEARRRGLTAEPCKHGRALVEAGLIEAPRPVAASQDRPEAPRLRPRDEFDPPGSPAFLPVEPPTPADRQRASAFGIRLPEPPATPCPTPAEAQSVEPCPECGEAHEPDPDTGDPAAWPAWTDEVGAQEPDATMPLVAWLRLQVAFYHALGTKAADLVAEHLAVLVTEAEITQARTPTQLRDRRAALAV